MQHQHDITIYRKNANNNSNIVNIMWTTACFFPHIHVFFLSVYRANFLFMTLSEEMWFWLKMQTNCEQTSFLHHLCVFFLSVYRGNLLTPNEGSVTPVKIVNILLTAKVYCTNYAFFSFQIIGRFFKTLKVRKMTCETGMLTNCENSRNNRNTWPFFSFRCIEGISY